jgi:hypothetical protein
MIRYSLQCEQGHAFEGWFRASDDYDRQHKRRLVICPSCGTTKVEKALMAPGIVTSEMAAAARRSHPEAAPPAPASRPPPQHAAPSLIASPEQRELLRRMRALRDEVLKKSEYVGPRFAEEARKIHDEVAPARGIHGQATPDEVKSLTEDGIEVYPVPMLPDDQN